MKPLKGNFFQVLLIETNPVEPLIVYSHHCCFFTMMLSQLGNRLSTYPDNDGIIWKPIYKWSGTNSTWLEYLENATNEIRRHIAEDEASKETSVVRERGYKVLKTLLLRRYESSIQIEASSVLERLYDSISNGTRDGIQPPPMDIPVRKPRSSTTSIASTDTNIESLDNGTYWWIPEYNLRRVGYWLQQFCEQSTEGEAHKIATKIGHNHNGFETLKRLCNKFGTVSTQDCVLKYKWGSGSFNTEWLEFKRTVAISRICELDPKIGPKCIAIAQRGIKRYRFFNEFAHEIVTQVGTFEPDWTWYEFQKFVDSFVQKFLNESLQRIKQKFLPELSIHHVMSDFKEECLHVASCEILDTLTQGSTEMTYLQNERGFLPGVIPEEKPFSITQSRDTLKSPKEQNRNYALSLGNKWNNGSKNNRPLANRPVRNDKSAKRCLELPKKGKNRSPIHTKDIGSPTSNSVGKCSE